MHAIVVASPFAHIAALGEHHPVYAIDTLGDAGRSTQTAPVRTGVDIARWLDEVLGALGLHRIHLVGLSYGGWLALNQALRSPGPLASATVVDPPGAIGRPRATLLPRMLADVLLASLAKSDPALHRLLARLDNGTPPAPPLLDLSVAGLRTFRGKQAAPKRMTDDELRAITPPVLLLFGARSPVNHASRAAGRARRLVPNVEADVVRDAGHMLPVEMPDVFARRVLGFIEGVDTGAAGA